MAEQSILLFYIAVAVLFAVFAFFLVFYIVINNRKQNQNELERQRLLYEHQHNLLKTRSEEQERIMSQISKEVHDNVGQVLNFLLMNMRVIETKSADNELAETIHNGVTMLTQLTEDVSNISRSLNGEYIKARGLAEILGNELKHISATKNFSCELKIAGNREHKILNADGELVAYRIAQEAIQNILKHSKAGKIDVSLHYGPEKFVMVVADNGAGFSTDELKGLQGMGMQNMQERSKFLNGNLNVESGPGKGCSITLEVPRNTQVEVC
jgi:signal transduction histidine kinase